MKQLNKDQLEGLRVYHSLVVDNYGKNKKEKLKETARRLKRSWHTVRTWVDRWYDKWVEALGESLNQENSKKLSFGALTKKFILDGYTEKQAKYIIARMSGMGKKESAIYAGYSEKTASVAAAKLENNPKVQSAIKDIREELKHDTKYSFSNLLNEFHDNAMKAKNGVTVSEYEEKNGADGLETKKKVSKIISFQASNQALSAIKDMMGYNYQDQLKAEEVEIKRKTGLGPEENKEYADAMRDKYRSRVKGND